MFSNAKIGLLALVFFLSGCATSGNSQMWLPHSQMWPPTKVAIHFNKLFSARIQRQQEAYNQGLLTDLPQGSHHSKEKYKEFIQDIFRRLFSEVEIIEKTEDMEASKSIAIFLIDFEQTNSTGTIYIDINAKVRLLSPSNKELFFGRNSTSTFNWAGAVSEYRGATNKTFVPILRNLAQNDQVSSYFMSKHTPQYANQFRKLSPPVTPSPQQQQAQIPQQQVATLKAGTGVMLGEAGYILTSYHLVRGMKQIRVKFVNGEEIDAPLFIKDEVNDIAFLKLNQSPNISLMNIAMGDSSQMQIGNKVFTIGYPISNILGQKPKYSEGVINSLSGIKDNLGFFQVSVPIQSGNSGGPLFNQHGELVAMVSSSLDPENTFRVLGTMPQNVNFAVKSSLVKNMIPMLPETLAAPTGIVVVPTDTDSLQSFIKRVQNNIVLIEAKE